MPSHGALPRLLMRAPTDAATGATTCPRPPRLLPHRLSHQIDFQLFPRHEPALRAIVLVAVVLYVFLMATPFMPGIEIGLALMVLLGNKGAY